MYDILRSSIGDGCTAEQAVAAFVDMPGVSAALGFAAGTPACDIKTGAQLLGNMKVSYEGALSTNGTRFGGQREIAEAVASAVFGPAGLNAASVGRIVGISPEILKKGAQLKAANETAGPSKASSSVKVVREHSYPLQKVHSWFHGVDCAKVEIDKQTKRVYKRKLLTLPNGNTFHLDCEHRIRYCSKEELAESYMQSEQHRLIMEADPSLKFSIKTAQECICDCIKECKALECICPVCTGFRYLLEAWVKMRTEARKTEVCVCPQCADGTKWRSASVSPSTWRQSSTCGKFDHPDLENPADGRTPQLNQLRCSLLQKKMTAQRRRETGAAEGAIDYYPPHAGGQCGSCGWSSMAPVDCSVEMSDSQMCSWLELQKDEGPNGEAVYCERTGTRKELLGKIKVEGVVYNYHMWVNQWTSLQDKLKHETFDPVTEIDVTADWAAGYKMMQHDNPKCSHGTTCNQYVALVLHSPGERPVEGGARPVQCDVWRIWSQAKGDSAWHILALKEIGLHYKNGKVPGLRRIKLCTDGQRSQFKGKKNLGATATLPHPELPVESLRLYDCLCRDGERACGTHMRPGIGIEVDHDFKASSHGSGPVDNFGKDPRRAMDDAVAAGDLTRYNFTHCYDWCVEKMAAPSEDKKHLGTFGANGEYIWRAYSKHGEQNPRGFPVIPVVRNYDALEGSNEIYHWRSRHAYLPQLEALFVSCYCIICRSGNQESCKYRHVTHSLVAGNVSKFFTTHERADGGAAGAADSDGDSD